MCDYLQTVVRFGDARKYNYLLKTYYKNVLVVKTSVKKMHRKNNGVRNSIETGYH